MGGREGGWEEGREEGRVGGRVGGWEGGWEEGRQGGEREGGKGRGRGGGGRGEEGLPPCLSTRLPLPSCPTAYLPPCIPHLLLPLHLLLLHGLPEHRQEAMLRQS